MPGTCLSYCDLKADAVTEELSYRFVGDQMPLTSLRAPKKDMRDYQELGLLAVIFVLMKLCLLRVEFLLLRRPKARSHKDPGMAGNSVIYQ